MSDEERECQMQRYLLLIASMRGIGTSEESILNFVDDLYQDYKIDKEMKEELIEYVNS